MTITVESPFPLHSLPRVWGWIQSFRNRVADDFGPQTLEAFVEKGIADAERVRTWAVYRDGELGGMVTFEKWTEILGTCHCLFKREMWGRKTTLPALEQILKEIFAEGILKISLCVFADNKAIIALVKDLGGVTEGHYRNHTRRNGELVDMVAIALFQEGFEHATSSRSSHRGDLVDHRREPGGEVEDHHLDDHPIVEPGHATASGPVERLLVEAAYGS